MITFSDPLSVKQAMTYNWGKGFFVGKLAEEWGIKGKEVAQEQFEHLVHGRHPVTGQQLVKFVEPYETTNKYGDKIMTIGHRVGVDMVVRPPKWVSLLAYNSGDANLKRELWRLHIRSALQAAKMAEEYAAVRKNDGRWAPSKNTIAAVFHHPRSRPDDIEGHATPGIHSHVIFFNMSKDMDDPNGKIRSVQESPWYDIQSYLTAAYRSLLSEGAQQIGIALEVDRNGVPQAVGISPEYIKAASPRRAQIERQANEIVERMRGRGHDVDYSPQVMKRAAQRGRESKDFSEEEMEAKDAALEEQFKNAAHKVAENVRERGPIVRIEEQVEARSRQAVTFAVNHLSENNAVYDRHTVFIEAINVDILRTSLKAIRQEIERREASGELVGIAREEKMGLPEQTTNRMLKLEQSNIDLMMQGRGAHPPMASIQTAEELIAHFSERQKVVLNASQHQAIKGLLESGDQVVALQGPAGGGKTTALKVAARAMEQHGFEVIGLGPTGIASKQLEPADINHQTLDSFLATKVKGMPRPRFFILDEASLTGSAKLNDLLLRLRPGDRLLLVGDRNQHESIAAGAPFRQAQDARISTIWITEIVRQQTPEYKFVSESLQAGKIGLAIEKLLEQGKVIEVEDNEKGEGWPRYRAIAREYLRNPDGNLALCPDNLGRVAANNMVHIGLQKQGAISQIDHPIKVFVNGRGMTAAERQIAHKYLEGDVLRYQKGSTQPSINIRPGQYGRVIDRTKVSDEKNELTVKLDDGRTVVYDPRRLYGVDIFKEDMRNFSEGDVVQYRRPQDERGPYGKRNRLAVTSELGTIEKIEGHIFTIRKRDGKLITFDIREFRHLDHGYATTSFLSQSLTAPDTVIIHIDTRSSRVLVNRRMLKVAATRAAKDIRIITNSKKDLLKAVSRKYDNSIAMHAVEDTRMWEVKLEAERAQAIADSMMMEDESQQFNFDDLPAPPKAQSAPQRTAPAPALRKVESEPAKEESIGPAALQEPRAFKRDVEIKEYEEREPYVKYGKRDWARATRSKPCPVCEGDGCSITHDRKMVRCWRVASPIQNKGGAWVHKLDEVAQARIPVIKKVQVNQFDPASIEKRHEVYDALLKSPALGLMKRDRDELLARGLDADAINRNGYRSVPKPGYLEEVIKQMGDRDYRGIPGFFTTTESLLYKMPGFYTRGIGAWSINIGAWMDRQMKVHANSDGYFIPVRNEKGQVEAMKVRRMAGNKPKYLWFSSAERESGSSPSTPLHFQNPEKVKQSGQVIVVEGPLKADVTAHLLNYEYAVIGIGGVNTFGERFGEELKRRIPGVKQVVVAFDMDVETNKNVQRALKEVHGNLQRAGIDSRNLQWPWDASTATDKGLDDYLFSAEGHRQSVRQFMREAAQSIGAPKRGEERSQKRHQRGYSM